MLRTLSFSDLALVLGICPRCAAEDAIEFPLPYFEDAIYVPVTIDGNDHLFLLDTGASVNMFHTSLRKHLAAPINSRMSRMVDDGVGKKFSIEETSMPVAAVGGKPLARFSNAACADISPISAAIGRDVEGVLGMPFFISNVVQIDFDARKLKILPAQTPPSEEWGAPIDVTFRESGLAVVSGRFGNFENEPCSIDTGASASLILRKDLFDRLAKEGAIKSRATTTVATVSNPARICDVGILSTFALAGTEHQELRVSGGNTSSSIGLNYFRRYRVTFDFGRQRLYLAPGFDFRRSDVRPKIGVNLTRKDDKPWVTAVDAETAADRAGFKAGDELVSIGGNEILDNPNAEIGWRLRAGAKSPQGTSVIVRRDGQLVTLTLKFN